jgi:hypothetical protein
MNADDFSSALKNEFFVAQRKGNKFVDINAGNLHRQVGGYPGTSHRMPICCDVMKAAMKGGDQVLEQPPKGKGASLTIRYMLHELVGVEERI